MKAFVQKGQLHYVEMLISEWVQMYMCRIE